MKKYIFLVIFIELILVGAFLLSPGLSAAQSGGTVDLFNPLGVKGVNTPGELVFKSFQGFIAIIGLVAIAFTVFNGFKLMVAGTEEAVQTAREGLTWSVGGFAAALLSFSLIAATEKFLGFDINRVGLGSDTLGTPIFFGGKPQDDFLAVLGFVMVNFLGLVGFASTLMMIYYGYRYVTSAGNEEAVEKAKVGLKWTVAGLIITLLAFTIINSVQQYLTRGAS